MTKETFYEDGKTNAESTITYKYDNSRGLAKITDTAPGITYRYYYDFTDRLMKYPESGDAYDASLAMPVALLTYALKQNYKVRNLCEERQNEYSAICPPVNSGGHIFVRIV